jgi:hypothetical protein
MASVSQQGSYLGMTLIGFTAFAGGLVAGGAIGIVAAIIGLVLLIASAAGFYSVRNVGS